MKYFSNPDTKNKPFCHSKQADCDLKKYYFEVSRLRWLAKKTIATSPIIKNSYDESLREVLVAGIKQYHLALHAITHFALEKKTLKLSARTNLTIHYSFLLVAVSVV